MIVIEPLGGLGNQLFVYGVGLASSKTLGVPLVADLRSIRHDSKRRFELSTFRNSLHDSRVEVQVPTGPRFQLHRIVGTRLGKNGVFQNFHYETRPGFDERFLHVPDGSRLRGYFQSWKYLESVKGQLQGELRDLINPSPWFTEQFARLSASTGWTGVHVRLGDYKDTPGMQISESYYSRAMGLLGAVGSLQQILVFSDEVDLAKKMKVWQKFPRVVFVESGGGGTPLETMLLMSLADQLVIANSTFSWWAAWLGAREERRVIYPNPWGNMACENRDLIPPDWIGLGREL